MESSDRVLALGQEIAKNLTNSHDVTGRWIAYYIAELMQKAENAKDEERASIERTCYDTILKLWSHNSSYPADSLPFRDYDAVFKTLMRIDPNNETPFYARNDVAAPNENSDAQIYLDMALVIDDSVRILFEQILECVIQAKPGDVAIGYVKALLGLEDDDSLHLHTILRSLYSMETEIDAESANRKQIEDKIAKLEFLSHFTQDTLDSLRQQLT